MVSEFSLKNILYYAVKLCNDCEFRYRFVGLQTGMGYEFIVKDNEITVNVSEQATDIVMYKIVDIYSTEFKDKVFKPTQYHRIVYQPDGKFFYEERQAITAVNQLYIKVFKDMKERVSFVIRHNGRNINCYYVDGKVLYLEETDKILKLFGSNLSRLNDNFPGYEILYFSNSINKQKYGVYLGSIRHLASMKGKKLEQYLFGVLQTNGGYR